ncbi:hypothetical protein MTES_3223 [Microbacterium testaceum StLB037]|uniref:DUF4349 domain-containing protein n=1 Tax=Microbacterium testaceum (strain StLB037) TaxID=979556 RepID=E8NCV7_MICTS|nr:DUF4349 domain-containing protein [Microbacterium testaceum]BAJ76187.1 hypothetical protein MTES_3223 [Microbacterium testaceum StLB037]
MTTPTLPPLDDSQVDAMETRIFARIHDSAHADRRRRRARIGGWTAAAAGVVLIAAIVGPAVLNGGDRALFEQSASGGGSVTEQNAGSADSAPLAPSVDGARGEAAPGASDTTTREIIANGSATIEANDVAAAVTQISDAATSVGGYVESSQVGGSSGVVPLEGDTVRESANGDPSTAWVTVRIPADKLSSVMDRLSAVGTVTASSVSRSDVTDQAVDLRARVTAGEASVARLTELMSQAASVSDLITAESALAQRQAQLDADRQQLTLLETQVSMSSLSVQVVPATATVSADPAGFGDGLLAGWNGLVAALNGVVIGLGFLLPWIAVAAIVGAVVWAVRRVLRRRRAAREG